MRWLCDNLEIDGPPILCIICKKLLNNPDTGDDEYFLLYGISDEQYDQIIEIWKVDPGEGFPVCGDCIHGHSGAELNLNADVWLYDYWQEYLGNSEQIDSISSQ